MPSALGQLDARASKIKWKGKETIGFTFFELPCHTQKDLLSFLSIYYKRRIPFLLLEWKGPRYSHVDYSTWLALPLRRVLIDLFIATCLDSRLWTDAFLATFIAPSFFPIFPCRFFFLQARLEAYICKYPLGIMNQGVVKPRRLSAGMTSRAGSGWPGRSRFLIKGASVS